MDTVTAPEAVLETPAPVESDTLTALDRCDKCGAQAYVVVTLKTGDLNFCSHDFNEVEAKLSAISIAVTDERWKLHKTAKLDVSAD